jgi:hypothetical protein
VVTRLSQRLVYPSSEFPMMPSRKDFTVSDRVEIGKALKGDLL